MRAGQYKAAQKEDEALVKTDLGLWQVMRRAQSSYQARDLPPSSSLHRLAQSLQVSTNILVIRKHQDILTLTWDIYK